MMRIRQYIYSIYIYIYIRCGFFFNVNCSSNSFELYLVEIFLTDIKGPIHNFSKLSYSRLLPCRCFGKQFPHICEQTEYQIDFMPGNIDESSGFLNSGYCLLPQTAKCMGPSWGPPGSCRPQMGPTLASWTLLSVTSRYPLVFYCSRLSFGGSVYWPTDLWLKCIRSYCLTITTVTNECSQMYC